MLKLKLTATSSSESSSSIAAPINPEIKALSADLTFRQELLEILETTHGALLVLSNDTDAEESCRQRELKRRSEEPGLAPKK